MSNRLILHIGSPKTGSTSIQEIFAKNRQNMINQGIIYPGKNTDHHFLYFASKASRDKWPRHFRGMDPQKLKRYVENYFSELEKDFRSNRDVIMSTEYIFFKEKELVENIVSYLRQFFSEIKVICFLRHPIGYYRSFQQQLIKGQSFLQSPQSFRYEFKNVIETWGSFCDEVIVLPFKKTENSFIKLCNQFDLDISNFNNVDHRSKSSISIEQMLLFEKIYKNIYQKYDNQLTGKLHVKALAQINPQFTHKPELKEGVVSIIYDNHVEDLEWLKEKYAISFFQDYTSINRLHNSPTFENGKAAVRDIYKVPSEESVEKYEALVIDALLKKLVQSN